MLRTVIAGMVMAAVLLPAQAIAQADSGAKMYGKGRFAGPRRVLLGPTRLEVPFTMKSVEIPAGSQWEFCSGSTFTGCRQYNQSDTAMVMTVRSARPVNAIIVSGGPAGATVVQGGAGQSLRGIASEYFVAPDAGGNRIEATPGTAEAMSQRAAEFCRGRGWRTSAHARLQSIGGRFYIADVLCVDTDG